MTTPIGSPTDIAAKSVATSGAGTGAAQPTRAQVAEAARQFDAVFVRIVLSALQKTTKVGGADGLSAGQSAYGSMVVDTVSDAVTRGGGTGLADKLMEALGPRLADAVPVAPAAGGAAPGISAAAHGPVRASVPAGAAPAGGIRP